MIQPNTPQTGLQKNLSFLHSRIQVISRQDFNKLSHDKGVNSHNKKVQKVGSRLTPRSSEQTYKVVNAFFPKPLTIKKITNGHALKKAVFEVKPCMDLRQVRRGRKVFQIPRVVPPLKRQLFGVRRLLSVLNSPNRQNVPVSMKSSDSTPRNKDKVTGENRGTLSSLREIIPKKLSLSENLQSNKTLLSIDKKEALLSKISLINAFKGPHTREALTKDDKKASLLSLSDSLSHEIKACSRSYSRSIENKKRVYKTASANRGCIRMAWWL